MTIDHQSFNGDSESSLERRGRYVELPQDAIAQINLLSGEVTAAENIDGMQSSLLKLDTYMDSIEVKGAAVRITSDRVQLVRETLTRDQEGAINIHYQLELPSNSVYDGVFSHCDVLMPEDSDMEVIYVIEQVSDDGSMLEITAPITAAKIEIIAEEQVNPDDFSDRMEPSIDTMIERLGSVDDEYVISRKSELRDLLTNSDTIDAQLLSSAERIIDEITTRDNFDGRTDMSDVIIELMAALVEQVDWARVSGLEVAVRADEDGKRLVLSPIDIIAEVSGVSMVDGFHEAGLVSGGRQFKATGTVQPALVVEDSQGREWFIPFRYLTEFVPVSDEDLSRPHEDCNAVIQRLRQTNPEYFDYSLGSLDDRSESHE